MTNPSPQNLTQLTRLTRLITPVQAPLTGRQQVTGEVGRLYGANRDRSAARVDRSRTPPAYRTGARLVPPS